MDSAAASAITSRRARAAARWYAGLNRHSALSSSASMSSAAATAAQVEPSARRSAARDSTASMSRVTAGMTALGGKGMSGGHHRPRVYTLGYGLPPPPGAPRF